jgi:hypothetical protein
MIAQSDFRRNGQSPNGWHKPFVEMLPQIDRYLRITFRDLNPDARAEAVQEGLVNALVAYRRLYEKGKVDLAYPTVLARYAASQIRDGRQVAERLNIRDVLSTHAQQKKGIKVERLDRFDEEEDAWKEVLIEDRHSTPAEVAVARVDFAAWLGLLPARLRKITKLLATGESTGTVAKRFDVSSGRISQLRQELKTSWETFQGEASADLAVA